MKNSWLEKSANRSNEETITRLFLMQHTLDQLKFDCKSIEYQRKRIEEVLIHKAQPGTFTVEDYLTWQRRCALAMGERIKVLESLVEAQQKKLMNKCVTDDDESGET